MLAMVFSYFLISGNLKQCLSLVSFRCSQQICVGEVNRSHDQHGKIQVKMSNDPGTQNRL